MNTTVRWKRFNVFISSTFRDMDFERDIIKSKVIPALNNRFRSQRVEIQAVDLRMGVNTEEMDEAEAASKVLRVCAQNIDAARPFFIGLVGARYGWIPPKDIWQQFIDRLPEDQREAMRQTEGKSVTEMEIIYGALSQYSLDTSHTLFYSRDDSSYKDVPEDRLPEFYDSDPILQQKLKALKHTIRQRIYEKGGEDDLVTLYHLDWDDEMDNFDEDSSNFEELVTEQITRQIEQELPKNEELVWWQEEKLMAESTLARLLPGICTTLPHFEEQLENLIIVGDEGNGRSTLLAWQWNRRRQDTEDICLVGIVGLTPLSSHILPLLTRWCYEIADSIGESDNDYTDFIMTADKPLSVVCDEFYRLVDRAYEQGREVCLFIDDADRFYATEPAAVRLAWIDYRVKALVTCSLDYSNEVTHIVRDWGDTILLNGLQGDDMMRLIHTVELNMKTELPQNVRKRIASMPHPAAFPAALIRMFNIGMNYVAFDEVRKDSGKSAIDALNSYIEECYDNAFQDDEDDIRIAPSTIAYMVCKSLDLDEEWWLNMLNYIYCSPVGLRLSDLQALGEDDWDDIEWAQLTFYLQEYLHEDIHHLWHINEFVCNEEDKTPYAELADYVATLPADDWLRQSMEGYFVVMAEDKELFEESEFTMSPTSAYHLMFNYYWRVEKDDGPLEAFCQQLEKSDRKRLVDMLWSCIYDNHQETWELNRHAMDAMWDNLIVPAEFNDLNEIRSIIEESEEILGNAITYRFAKMLAHISPVPQKEEKPNPYANWTAGAEKPSKIISLFKGKPTCLDELKSLLKPLSTLLLPTSIDDPMLLENLTLLLISIDGAIYRLKHSPKESARIPADVLDDMASAAISGYMATYQRLCQISPDNRLINQLNVMLSMTASDYEFYTDSETIRAAIDDLKSARL